MFDLINHTRLAYPSDEVQKLLGGINPVQLANLMSEHKIHTFRIGRKRLIPAFEIDRMISERMRDEHQKQFLESTRVSAQV